MLSPRKGARPVSSSKSMHPAEYRSDRSSTACPWACSGERYWAVPTTDWVCVIVALASARARAMPKSITLMVPSAPIMTLAGLMSRCTMPLRWL